VLLGLLRTLWRLSLQDLHDWLVSWPALAVACGLPIDPQGRPPVPSPATLSKRAARLGAPAYEVLFLQTVRQALRTRLIGARDLILDSAPIKAWRVADPDAQVGHAPAHHPSAWLRGFRVHTLICRGSGLPIAFRLAPANRHDAPFARPLLALAVQLYGLRIRVVRLDAAYWGPALVAWIHTTLHAVAVIPWNPQRTKQRSCLPPTWTRPELGKRTSIERFFGRVLLFFRLQRPPLVGWTALTQQVALSYTASILVGLAAQDAGRPDLIRSPKRVLAHAWEGLLAS
jgi:transposase